MMQACSAIAGLVLNSEIDAKLLVERGAVEVVIQMMRFGLEDEIPEGGEDHAAGPLCCVRTECSMAQGERSSSGQCHLGFHTSSIDCKEGDCRWCNQAANPAVYRG